MVEILVAQEGKFKLPVLSGSSERSDRFHVITVQDLDGITHTVDVTAESLYEAVAQGLAALRRSDWVAGFQQGIITVSVADVRVEHKVKLADFTNWLDRTNASSPREMVQSQPGGVKGNPSFRSFSAINAMVLRNGETGQFTTVTDNVTGETMKADVTLTILK